MPSVRLVSLGNPERTLDLPEGCTVEQAIQVAELSPDVEVRVRGERVTDPANTQVGEGETILASPPAAKHG